MAGRPTDPGQLALSLEHPARFSRDDFLASPSNAAALEMVDRWPDWPARALVLAGPEGAGKSHLAAVWAERAGARILPAAALGEAGGPDALAAGALVLEDVRSGVDEVALFHLLNLARDQGTWLLLTVAAPPAGWTLRLPDLHSRLRAMPVVQVAPPDAALLRAVLVKLFADRQLAVDEGLLTWLERRIERSFAAARAAVATLDREGLRRQRPVTRALAVAVLGRAGEDDPEEGDPAGDDPEDDPGAPPGPARAGPPAA
ncbi:chromosomal replication initiator DnaA [Rhodoplanes sp. TEM]|uniref:Chromosomal replication initiator DnaA n=1 Tax=Rhodoplanes tepidamans TaxID=200616 RepID=A0ABT5JEM1_RHOTP|nr:MULTISPECIES: chromosomal replication initiator DnaA [Rhodoplanes]MDC7787776.1 chromosomal replication initiator DnaA [Rhodoplanes tepidamans]MDC7982661.1 chromosomal replication initiator DnaA [Rhodoplanes sp. TEM]MDQ0357692.1 chromosomal replication initiation ATPase DnaA [Rhodoplanes tepidamans]